MVLMNKHLKMFASCMIGLIIAICGQVRGNEYDASSLVGLGACDGASDGINYNDYYTLNETTKGVINHMAPISESLIYTDILLLFFPNVEVFNSWSSPTNKGFGWNAKCFEVVNGQITSKIADCYMPSQNVNFTTQIQITICASTPKGKMMMEMPTCIEDCKLSGSNWYIDFECCSNDTNTTTTTTTTDRITNNAVTAPSCTATTPSIIQPSGFFSLNKMLINGEQLFFSFRVFTTNSGCEITSYELFESDASTSKHDWGIVADSVSVHVTLPDYLKDIPQNYSIILRVTADHRHSQDIPLTLMVLKCALDQISITETQIYPDHLSQTQLTSPGPQNFFSLPQFHSNPSDCSVITNITILAAPDANLSSSLLIDRANLWTGGRWVVRPLDQLKADVTYRFRIRVADSVGNILTSQSVYTLIVGPYDAQSSIQAQNNYPVFSQQPQCPDVYVDLGNLTNATLYKCMFPDINSKINRGLVQINIFGADKQFIQFNQNNTVLFINKTQLTRDDIGEYPLTIQLVDNQRGQTNYTLLVNIVDQLSLQGSQFGNDFGRDGQSPSSQNGQWTGSDNQNLFSQDGLENQTTKYIEWRIAQINSFGLVTVKFNETMKTKHVNITHINSTVLDIQVLLTDNYDQPDREVSDTNMSLINENVKFTWQTVQFTDDCIQFQLNFSKPAYISQNIEQDWLVITLTDIKYGELFFVSNTTLSTLHQDNFKIKRRIRRQLRATELNQVLAKSAIHLNSFALSLIIASIILYLITQGGRAMTHMFVMVRSLQIVFHLPIIRVIFPANVMLFVSSLIPTIGFDVLEASFDWEEQKTLKFNYERHDKIKDVYLNQISDLGYDSFNSIMLLQTLAVLLIIYLVQVALLAIVALFVKLTKNKLCGNKFVQKHSKQLFFGPIIELYIQGYFEFVISSILTLKYMDYKLMGERLAHYISYFSLTFAVALLPIALIALQFLKSDTLVKEEVLARWGQLYSNVDPIKKVNILTTRAYYMVFVFRRMIIIGTGFFFFSTPIYQILCVIFLQLGYIIYQGYFRPSESRTINILDNFNEWQCLVCTSWLFLFTDLTPSPETQEIIGYIWILMLLVLTSINIVLIVYHFIRRLIFYMIFLFIKARQILRRWCGIEEKIQEEEESEAEESEEVRTIEKVVEEGEEVQEDALRQDSKFKEEEVEQVKQEKEQIQEQPNDQFQYNTIQNPKTICFNQNKTISIDKTLDCVEDSTRIGKDSGNQFDNEASFGEVAARYIEKTKNIKAQNIESSPVNLVKKESLKATSAKKEEMSAIVKQQMIETFVNDIGLNLDQPIRQKTQRGLTQNIQKKIPNKNMKNLTSKLQNIIKPQNQDKTNRHQISVNKQSKNPPGLNSDNLQVKSPIQRQNTSFEAPIQDKIMTSHYVRKSSQNKQPLIKQQGSSLKGLMAKINIGNQKKDINKQQNLAALNKELDQLYKHYAQEFIKLQVEAKGVSKNSNVQKRLEAEIKKCKTKIRAAKSGVHARPNPHSASRSNLPTSTNPTSSALNPETHLMTIPEEDQQSVRETEQENGSQQKL